MSSECLVKQYVFTSVFVILVASISKQRLTFLLFQNLNPPGFQIGYGFMFL